MATEWADTCEWKRGQPSRNESELPYDPIGQNLYVTSDTIDLVSAVQSWYNETENYDYDNNSCSGECGDYMQVVWAESREVGCAYSTCDQMNGTNVTSGTYLVCNYGPAANSSVQPFTKGAACSACGSGESSCDAELCGEPTATTTTTATVSSLETGTQAGETTPTTPATATATAIDGRTTESTTDTATTTPESANATTPDSATATTPESATATTPEAATATTPESATATTPESATATTPEPATATTPESATATTPESATATTPESATATTPGSATATTPESATATTPETEIATPTSGAATTATTSNDTMTAASETTTVAPVGPCAGVTCHNGGSAQVQNDKCNCRCSADWQGTNCQESRAQATIGVILKIRAHMEKWTMLWGFIRPIIVKAINRHCNSHVSTCCKGATEIVK
ncbi:hypothetical protein LSAT2_010339 [Lamellibrachia satsuma]|nr:hypothetical protein LSAT2_010339 [Lamellibrachia satsuma]